MSNITFSNIVVIILAFFLSSSWAYNNEALQTIEWQQKLIKELQLDKEDAIKDIEFYMRLYNSCKETKAI